MAKVIRLLKSRSATIPSWVDLQSVSDLTRLPLKILSMRIALAIIGYCGFVPGFAISEKQTRGYICRDVMFLAHESQPDGRDR